MTHRLRAVAFDVDAASLISLREALPEWEIEVVNGATAASLTQARNPGGADLLIVMAREKVAETVGLCRFLVGCGVLSIDSGNEVAETSLHSSGQNQECADAPLLVLVPSGHEPLVRAALEAGAHRCLVLPVHSKEVASVVAHALPGNQPGRITLNLDQSQSEDRWRDDGGEG